MTRPTLRTVLIDHLREDHGCVKEWTGDEYEPVGGASMSDRERAMTALTALLCGRDLVITGRPHETTSEAIDREHCPAAAELLDAISANPEAKAALAAYLGMDTVIPEAYQSGWNAGHLTGVNDERRRALNAPDTAPSELRAALDVERLARAVIAAADKGGWAVYRTRDGGASWMDRREVARQVAEEYGR